MSSVLLRATGDYSNHPAATSPNSVLISGNPAPTKKQHARMDSPVGSDANGDWTQPRLFRLEMRVESLKNCSLRPGCRNKTGLNQVFREPA
jgi:hypothetical protein